jgi:hypothetical protein
MKKALGAAGCALSLATALCCGPTKEVAGASESPAPSPSPTNVAVDDGAFYISPSGDDSNDGRSEAKPFRSFEHAFARLPHGGTLVLLDGAYSETAGTGLIHYEGRRAGQPPSGLDRDRPTRVTALHPGAVTVQGALFLGRSTRKDSYIHISGITFRGGGALYNTSYVTVKECGFHGPFDIGTNDHDQGNTRDLIEDVWIWASGTRLVASNYRSHENVWRRVIVRGDGCGTSDCRGSGNPNVGITVYDSHDVSLQNVMVIDRVLAPGDEPYADFAAAQHTEAAQYHLGRCSWLGTISLKAPDSGYYFEPDATIAPTFRVVNAIAWDARSDGFNLARAGTENLLENLTARSLEEDAVRVAPEMRAGTLRNVLVEGAGRFGINSAYPPSYANVHGAAESPYNQTTCQAGCHAEDARALGALRFLPRIERGSFLSGSGNAGGDIGANVVNRYGVDGGRFGDSGYDGLTETPLWPWPNEERIQREMCGDSGVTRGFCAAPSLTRYIWEYLGQPMPATPSSLDSARRAGESGR